MAYSGTTLPISVFCVMQDEEDNIARLLSSLRNIDEVILVDSGSTDRTVHIASQYENVNIVYHPWEGYAKQKQYAMALCKNEWVLNLDADEVLCPALYKKIEHIITLDHICGVRCARNDIFIYKKLSSLTKQPNNLRLYRKSQAEFDESALVHESATVTGKIMVINEAFDHYGYNDIASLSSKNNQYSTLKSQQKFNRGKKGSLLKLGLIFPLTFIKKFVLQRYIFSGRRGFILSVMDAYYAFMKEAKLFELEQKSEKQKE
ncbi:glycosyltransferase family 2 protein [Alteromonas ponticola]|uniref:Glycosyltransferase family 2 protein n=1 Tax=Alteromonas aquimaris TaxID=2998417 RepID=A0ABT3PAZ9_9ALTE|nr:glycosyltransferase family 2 protein [Alteromonas aquimaris]MCW8109959.1 glycosyltransferase family 2 protein [Alteromonas aquimaris]